MEASSKKKKDVPSAPAETKPLAASLASNGPVKVLRIDDVSASIFARDRQFCPHKAAYGTGAHDTETHWFPRSRIAAPSARSR